MQDMCDFPGVSVRRVGKAFRASSHVITVSGMAPGYSEHWRCRRNVKTQDPSSATSSLSQGNRLVSALAVAVSAVLLRVPRLSSHSVFHVKVETVTERGAHAHEGEPSARCGSRKWAPRVLGW